jgi:hypothetical protein
VEIMQIKGRFSLGWYQKIIYHNHRMSNARAIHFNGDVRGNS